LNALNDKRAAILALERATANLERVSGNIGRWKRETGEWEWSHRTSMRLLLEWETAWEDYRLALVVAASVAPRRLRRWQRRHAALVSDELAARRR
jgi:hypothetical protein